MEELKSLFDQVEAFELAPIESWHPDKTVSIDIRIDLAGTWFYRGSPINRHRIVKLFSTVLRLEGDQYFLVTPPLKYKIQVDDAPFTAVELNQKQDEEQQLFFRTNMDEVVLADEAHPITVVTDAKSGEPFPYITVRNDLTAKITRSVYYQLIELLEPSPNLNASSNLLGVSSAGVFFPFGSV